MSESGKPLSPVRPSGMEIIFLYPCPFCERSVPFVAPTRPVMVQCDSCRKNFPIVPVDEKLVRFYKTMLANGHAAIDPDFF
ncbi:hypothetical protein SAMN05660337_3408 [Maridesulfovibrio ferrireducens]|uniref:Uncharacterized protein n=1 Tax=Maridesulfovibrio ferrireducens TaxID=246191 RepID=A0A1G9LJD3_9BACT|nr:hypothetical protein [Maridesulfovibrio ferrireducens]SDL62052.1 hypothetical protein SAMN05660337_3408 [Maridesulfovibrio ferrireducens]